MENTYLRRPQKKNLLSICNAVSYWCICLFLLDCSITGGGHYLSIGPLVPRMIVGALAVIFALPELWRHRKKYIRNPINLLVLCFVVFAAIAAVRGYRAGNRMDVLMSDIKGFAWLVLVPVFISQVRTHAQLERILNFVLAGALVQAGMVLVINAICSLFPITGITLLYQPMMDILLGTVSSVSNSVFRIFMKSSPYMVAACVIIVFRQARAKKLKWRYALAISLLLDAILLSFTRSIYGCTGITACITLVVVLWCYRDCWKRIALFAVASLAGFLLLNAAQEVMYESSYLNFAMVRTFHVEVSDSLPSQVREYMRHRQDEQIQAEGTAEKQADAERREQYVTEETATADQVRIQTKTELMELIRRAPVFGNGLGASAPCRNGVDEYFYLDMLARMGVVGLVLYMLPFAYVALCLFRRRKLLPAAPAVPTVFCAIIAFWIVTWFNPWMNAVLGIAWYGLTVSLPFIEEMTASGEDRID